MPLSLNTQCTLHPQAKIDFSSTKVPAKQGFYLKIWDSITLCYLVFDDETIYNIWVQSLQEFMATQKPLEKNNFFGCIYDLSIADTQNLLWLDLKMTAVKHDMSSVTEYFLFDSSQEDLYKSVKEVLFAVDGHLDVANSLVFKEFLLELVRNLDMKKGSTDVLTGSTGKLEFKHEKNVVYREFYRGLSREDIDENIRKLMGRSQVAYDSTSNALKVLELQKLSLQAELNQMYSAKTSHKEESGRINIERNLDMVLQQRKVKFEEESKTSHCLGRIEACNCIVF